MRHPQQTPPEDERGIRLSQPQVEPEAIQAALAQVLASGDFDASERNRRFLSFVVEETLAGRGERIKAYGIAIAVFDRDDSFDPRATRSCGSKRAGCGAASSATT